MTTMHQGGYVAILELDEEGGFFHGEIVAARDVLTFQGRTLSELRTAFKGTIEDDAAWCRARGKESTNSD